MLKTRRLFNPPDWTGGTITHDPLQKLCEFLLKNKVKDQEIESALRMARQQLDPADPLVENLQWLSSYHKLKRRKKLMDKREDDSASRTGYAGGVHISKPLEEVLRSIGIKTPVPKQMGS